MAQALLTPGEILKQSEAVFAQFGESKWIPFAKENAKLERRNMEELRNSGIGKFMVLAAMGQSTEEKLDTLKRYRERYTLVTNDKCFGKLLENGVKADYVMLCDCNVLFDHLKPYVEETKGVNLISTPYGNTDWTHAWKGPRYFYVNKDAIASERHFLKIFGDGMRVIPASSNVSNAMLVFWTGSDEHQNVNWGGFERYLLVGYDYSWRTLKDGGKYYAFADPQPKRFYMQHRTALDVHKNVVLTSENLVFSAKWMESYIRIHGLPVYNCSGRGLLGTNLVDLDYVLSRVRAGDHTRRVKQNFLVSKLARQTFEAAVANFDKSREELICQATTH
jgi:hypothetical protein